MPKKINEAILDKLRNMQFALSPHEFSLRISSRGVPYLVSDKKISICYFKTTDIFRVFTNCGEFAKDQKRFDAKTGQEVLEIINKL